MVHADPDPLASAFYLAVADQRWEAAESAVVVSVDPVLSTAGFSIVSDPSASWVNSFVIYSCLASF